MRITIELDRSSPQMMETLSKSLIALGAQERAAFPPLVPPVCTTPSRPAVVEAEHTVTADEANGHDVEANGHDTEVEITRPVRKKRASKKRATKATPAEGGDTLAADDDSPEPAVAAKTDPVDPEAIRDVLRATANEFAEAFGLEELRAVITAHGGDMRMSEVAEARWPVVLEELRDRLQTSTVDIS